MNLKRSLIILILTLISFFAKAQNAVPSSIEHPENIRSYIQNNYKVSQKFIDTTCMNTIVFIKFNVVKNHIGSLVFSKNVPAEIKKGLKAAFLSTNGLWKLTTGKNKKMSGKIFLLPVIFYYQLGCNTGGNILTKVIEKPDLDYLLKQNSLNTPLHKGLRNMLQFEDSSNYSSLNCILIEPMTLGMME